MQERDEEDPGWAEKRGFFVISTPARVKGEVYKIEARTDMLKGLEMEPLTERQEAALEAAVNDAKIHFRWMKNNYQCYSSG